MTYQQWTADDQQFFIAAANIPAAAFALRGKLDAGYASLEEYLADYDQPALEMLGRQFEEYGWSLVANAAGDVVRIGDDGELNQYCHALEHLAFLADLAPFMSAGSFIELRDEDGERWRYVFDGHAVRFVDGRVTFD